MFSKFNLKFHLLFSDNVNVVVNFGLLGIDCFRRFVLKIDLIINEVITTLV